MIEQGIADCDERKDQEGRGRLKEALTKMAEDVETTQRFRDLVAAAFYARSSGASGPTKQKE